MYTHPLTLAERLQYSTRLSDWDRSTRFVPRAEEREGADACLGCGAPETPCGAFCSDLCEAQTNAALAPQDSPAGAVTEEDELPY